MGNITLKMGCHGNLVTCHFLYGEFVLVWLEIGGPPHPSFLSSHNEMIPMACGETSILVQVNSDRHSHHSTEQPPRSYILHPLRSSQRQSDIVHTLPSFTIVVSLVAAS